jgi:hypothetical protein
VFDGAVSDLQDERRRRRRSQIPEHSRTGDIASVAERLAEVQQVLTPWEHPAGTADASP